MVRDVLKIAQLSDLHCGTITFDAKLMASVVEQVNEVEPDLAIIVGDLTADGLEPAKAPFMRL
jgi:3',5'-cyclic-AMP phosphodiesterase